MTTKPWQLEWKQPQWHSPTAATTTIEGSLIDHAAALVYSTDFAAYHNANTTNNATCVLTVSLLQQQQTYVLGMQITRHDDSLNETNRTVLTSRVLTWPSFLQQQEEEESTARIWPWQSWFRQKTTSSSSNNKKNGMIAVCLCRLSQHNGHEEALEVLNGLALLQSQDSMVPESTDTKTTRKEMRLVCLASNGTVYLYNPWQLLSTSAQQDDNNNNSSMQDSMVSFLLGDALLQTLQQSMFPLCQPLRTWSAWNSRNSIVNSTSSSMSLQLHTIHSAVVAFDLLCVLGSYDMNETTHSQTGFIVFVSLRTFSELRTVPLGFVPLRLTPMLWKRREWVLVVGATEAVLIRTDASTITAQLEDDDTMVMIQRFQMLPIDFGELVLLDTSCQIIGWGMRPMEDSVVAICSVQDSTVRIWTRTLTAIRCRADSSAVESQNSTHVVTTQETRASFTEFQLFESSEAIPTASTDIPRFHMGPGWILMTGSSGVYFVCLEGATSSDGAYVQRMSTDAISSDRNPLVDIACLDEDDDVPFQLELPLSNHFSKSGKELGWQEGDGSSLNDIVLEALQDISNNSSGPKIDKDSPTTIIVSPNEKIQRLLRHCSSWKQLDESDTARKRYFERQLPCVSVGSEFIVSFRKRSITPKTRVPFQSVLSWLSSQEDYFTAASLALSLLQDVRTLRHLWQCFDKTENDDDLSTLEGLLDGILPLSSNDDKQVVGSNENSTLSQLADMAIGCLIKGGVEMSSTLNLFLATNLNYDPSRICLMLSAASSTSCSAWDNKTNDKLQQSDMNTVLWPVRALLEVGNARDCLWTAMLLLNAIIPNELRCRDSNATSSMELCQALVRLIVTLSGEATQMLFNLVDEQSQKYFWESLDDATRQELALIQVGGKFSLLRQVQVRSWAASHLLSMVEQLASITSLPIEWLKRFAMCCLCNAECPLSIQHDDVLSQSHEEDNDQLKRYKQQVSRLRNNLLAAPGSGGLDFDLLIPCLLILRTRNEPLFVTSSYSTQSVLNTTCHLAGRRNTEVPLFPMNAVVLMRECFLTGNVLAGAHLIGGKDGLVLQCCHVLMDCLDDNINMTEAEQFLLASATSLPVPFERRPSQSASPMELSESQCLLLFLLEENVLSVRKYGDFDSAHSREKLDPAFAARTILRTWWCTSTTSKSEWLMEWLDDALQLGMNNRMTTTSPYRLVCAALIRVLLWSEDDTPSLATRLCFTNDFLVRLSLSCCGLVEALPASVIEESWKQQPPYASSPVRKRPESRPCSPILSPSRMMSSDGMDDSFQSAVSSLDM